MKRKMKEAIIFADKSEYLFHYKYKNKDLMVSNLAPYGAVWSDFYISAFNSIESVFADPNLKAIILEKV